MVVLNFVFMGFLGGLAYVLINSKKWKDLKEFKSFRRYLLGAITGFLYYNLYSSWNWPNIIMSFVTGYMGTTFIESLIERLKPKPS